MKKSSSAKSTKKTKDLIVKRVKTKAGISQVKGYIGEDEKIVLAKIGDKWRIALSTGLPIEIGKAKILCSLYQKVFELLGSIKKTSE